MFKKLICLLLIMVMAINLFPTYEAQASDQTVFNAEELIEFEDGYFVGKAGDGLNVTKRISVSASQGAAVAIQLGALMDRPPKSKAADLTYKINVTEAGDYYVYMRNANLAAADSIWVKWDDGEYRNISTADDNSWTWTVHPTFKTYLSAGTHTLSFLRREVGCAFDAFVVTKDYSSFDTQSVEDDIANSVIDYKSSAYAENSTATTVTMTDGKAMIEAENMTIDDSKYSVASDSNASGQKYITPKTTTTAQSVDVEEKGAEFNFVVDETASSFKIWVRVAIPTGADSCFCSIDGEEYKMAGNFTTTKLSGSWQYEWRYIGSFGPLGAGTKHNFRLYPRELGNKIDKILITSDKYSVPTDMAGNLGQMTLPSGVYPAPTVTPPAEHPRLLFKDADIDTIKENMNKTQNAKAKAAFEEELLKDVDGTLATPVLEGSSNYDADILQTIEAYAFKYAIDGTTEYGNKAKNAMMKYLKNVSFDTQASGVTRPIGHVITNAAQVYDWCYDLFSEDERTELIKICESFAVLMEIGYPPKAADSIGGHNGEAQLMRDQLSLAIATYDERPDIYNYVAGRFLSEYVDGRNEWYESGTHYQGDSYGNYRYNWELIGQTIFSRMTGDQIRAFNDSQSQVSYYWMYMRRPDGQIFRSGDSFNTPSDSMYVTPYKHDMFVAGNFYADKYIKGEYELQNPDGELSAGYDLSITPVFFLINNNPEIEGETDKSELPLTKYFGSPSGTMIARTGWDSQWNTPGTTTNDDVVAFMKIGERWGGMDHYHPDAGTFQLYYKGILASESGYYELYGTSHDRGYNKSTVAHNTLTIHDPQEVTHTYSGTDNSGNKVNYNLNDGGQRQFASIDLESAEQQTGVVLDYAFGPDENEPEYSYIRGDITKAYGGHTENGEIVPKVSNVVRSMVFMPLEDPDYPAMMVIMDKVTSTDASFKKKWLLHTQTEPQISSDGKTTIVKDERSIQLDNSSATYDYNGKLTIQTMLPENPQTQKVGGEGKRYWVNLSGPDTSAGVNFDTKTPVSENDPIEAGWGRIEISPSTPSLEDKFLNVLAVSDADSTAAVLESELIDGENLIGVKTANKVIMFADMADPANSEQREQTKQRVTQNASFTVPGNASENVDILVAGVKAGVWSVSDGTTTRTIKAGENEATLYFEGKGATTYTLAYGQQAYSVKIADTRIEDSAANATKKVAVDVECSSASAPVGKITMFATDEDGNVISTQSKAFSAAGTYNFTINKSLMPDNGKKVNIKIYIWDSFFGMKPLASAAKTFVTKNGTN